MCADVSSANVVGYAQNGKKTGYAFACFGSSFVKPGTTGYTLKDLEIKLPTTVKNQTVARGNYIQFFATGTLLKVDPDRKFYQWQGQWYRAYGSGVTTDVPVEKPEEITMSIGEGFVTKLGTANAAVQYAGEVISGGEAKQLSVGKIGTYAFSVLANPCPYDITLKDLDIALPATVKNQTVARGNYIQLLATGTLLKVDADSKFYKWQGTWYRSYGSGVTTDVPIEKPEEIKILANEGFVAKLGTANAKVVFPTAL